MRVYGIKNLNSFTVIKNSFNINTYRPGYNKMKKLPLVNKQTKDIPIGPRLARVVVNTTKLKPQGSDSDPVPSSYDLEKPTFHTTNKLRRALLDAKQERPDVAKMVEEKLTSPNTAKYIRKKKASKLTIPESKIAYKDLVSLDVSGTSLIGGIEEDLRKRACAVQPSLRSPDPEPVLTDYFKEEEFLNVRTVGPFDTFPQTPKTPFATEPASIFRHTGILLGSDEFQ